MSQAQALYQLQTLETALDEAQRRLAAIQAQLQDHAALQQAKTALVTQTQVHQQAEGQVTDLDLELVALSTKITDNDTLLYSGQITNPRELQEREKELESLRHRREKLTQDLESARQNRQKTAQGLAEAQEYLTMVEQEVAAQNQDLVKEDEKLRRKMTGWLKDRKHLLLQISEDDQKAYKRLKTQKNGVAVVRLLGDSCSFCQIEQTQSRLHQIRQTHAVLPCEGCGRWLVNV